MNHELLKQQVFRYWNVASCGTEFIEHEKYSKEYFEAIEHFRYTIEPEIHSFAQFSRAHGKKVLEVGVGAGTDFLQWIRSGAQAYGIDLTQEAITNVQKRLALYNLAAQQVSVADAEQLPYHDNFFDIVYSWGVIHHSPDTFKCMQEIVRVCKPGGTIKVMIYNRHSLFAYYRYILTALCKGKPWRSLKKVLWYDQESLGTKAYTHKEIQQWLKNLPVECIALHSPATAHDLLYYKSKQYQFLARLAANLLGWHRCGWFMMLTLRKY